MSAPKKLWKLYVNWFWAWDEWAFGFDRWEGGDWDLWIGPFNLGGYR